MTPLPIFVLQLAVHHIIIRVYNKKYSKEFIIFSFTKTMIRVKLIDCSLKILKLIILLFSVFKISAQKIPPVATDDSYTGSLNRNLNISVGTGVLSNDTDANAGTILSVDTTPIADVLNGSLNLASDGSFNYIPNSGFVGTDSFQYRICDDGVPNSIVSQFDFDSNPLTTATVGPNATFINPDAVQTDCGVRIPPSLTGGAVGINATIPNTGGIFNFTSFIVDIEYRDQEGTADIVTAGNFRIYHITGDQIGVRVSVINSGTGLPATYTQNLGGFLPGNNPYSIEYDEITGNIIYNSNGTITTFSLAPSNSPLDTSLASTITLGRFMDNSGSALPSLCYVAITDTSKLCDIGEVTLTINANVITNRTITYRVNPD